MGDLTSVMSTSLSIFPTTGIAGANLRTSFSVRRHQSQIFTYKPVAFLVILWLYCIPGYKKIYREQWLLKD